MGAWQQVEPSIACDLATRDVDKKIDDRVLTDEIHPVSSRCIEVFVMANLANMDATKPIYPAHALCGAAEGSGSGCRAGRAPSWSSTGSRG